MPKHRPPRRKRTLGERLISFIWNAEPFSDENDYDRKGYPRQQPARRNQPTKPKQIQDFGADFDDDFVSSEKPKPEKVPPSVGTASARNSVRIVEEARPDNTSPKAVRLSESVRVFEDRKKETTKTLKTALKKNQVEIAAVPCKTLQNNSDHAVWEYSEGSVMVYGFVAAKSGPNSEDSEPLMVSVSSSSSRNRRIVIGVFDGMGGAGASMVGSSANSFSEAYRASRIIRQKTLEVSARLLAESVRSGKPRAVNARDLTTALKEVLQSSAQKLGIGSSGSSRIRGTLTKTLPSTLACAEIFIKDAESDKPTVTIFPIWAGDSRIWVLTPVAGLQQITADDVDIADPLEQLRQDPPMANVVSASVDFSLNQHQVQLSEPCVVIAGTDGISGYVRSPGEVELLILRAIDTAHTDGQELAEALYSAFSMLANDDASCVLAAIGFKDLESLRSSFQQRLEALEERYEQFESLGESTSFSSIVDGIWSNESKRYCAYMPSGRT